MVHASGVVRGFMLGGSWFVVHGSCVVHAFWGRFFQFLFSIFFLGFLGFLFFFALRRLQ
jgi:hypothetical protein